MSKTMEQICLRGGPYDGEIVDLDCAARRICLPVASDIRLVMSGDVPWSPSLHFAAYQRSDDHDSVGELPEFRYVIAEGKSGTMTIGGVEIPVKSWEAH